MVNALNRMFNQNKYNNRCYSYKVYTNRRKLGKQKIRATRITRSKNKQEKQIYILELVNLFLEKPRTSCAQRLIIIQTFIKRNRKNDIVYSGYFN